MVYKKIKIDGHVYALLLQSNLNKEKAFGYR